MIVTASTPSPDDDSDTAALAPVPRCRLCVAYVGGAEPVTSAPIADQVVGPSLAGAPVLASDGSTLAIVGHLPDGSTHVWSGTPHRLERRAELARGLHLASLVHRNGVWHLFGALDGARPYHAISGDLVTWHQDRVFAEEHPHLRVHGAASTPDGIVVLGHVVSNGRPIGWSLLTQDDARGARADVTDVGEPLADVEGHRRGAFGPRFRAREITFPLTAEHVVVGPAAIRDDVLAMAVTSGSGRLLARTAPGSRGRTWTLGLMSPDIAPTAVFACGSDVWLAGVDPAGGAPMMSVAGRRAFLLDRSGGPVVAAVTHGDHLVLARLPVASHVHDDTTVEAAGATFTTIAPVDASDDQSSPAYIDSISAA